MATLTANVKKARGMTNYYMGQRYSSYLATKSVNLESIEKFLNPYSVSHIVRFYYNKPNILSFTSDKCAESNIYIMYDITKL